MKKASLISAFALGIISVLFFYLCVSDKVHDSNRLALLTASLICGGFSIVIILLSEILDKINK